MLNSTPFFAAFGSLLCGRAPRGGLQALLGQWPLRPSLNQYMEAFGEFIPQALLARSKEKVNSRQRIFSPLVTFWAFLAQVLERGSSCRDALQRVGAWWQVHSPAQSSPSSDTSGYCQARARLDERAPTNWHPDGRATRAPGHQPAALAGPTGQNCRWHLSVDARYRCQPAPVATK
jgi:hypothetical protein